MCLRQLTLKVVHEVGVLSSIEKEHCGLATASIYQILKILLQMTNYLKVSLAKTIGLKMEYNQKKYSKEFCKVSKYLENYASTSRVRSSSAARAQEELTLETVDEPLETNQIHLCNGFKTILLKLDKFSKDRNFQAYNTKVNLTLALITEVGELAELLQWRKDESRNEELDLLKRKSICMEIADVAIYTMRLAVAYGIAENVQSYLFSSGDQYETSINGVEQNSG